MKQNTRAIVRFPRPRSLAMATAIALATSAAGAVADQRVIVTGTMTDSQSMGNPSGNMGGQNISLQDICNAASMAGMYAGAAEVELANQMARIGAPPDTAAQAREAMGDAMDQVCNDPIDEGEKTAPFVIEYTQCMMRMESAGQSMAIRLVPSANEAIMEIVDHNTREAQTIDMNYDLGQVQQVTGRGEATALQMSPSGQTGTRVGYDVKEYTFNYSISAGDGIFGQMEGGEAMAGMFGGLSEMTRVTTTGSAWIAADAPGVGIVSDFYDNLAGIAEDGQGAGFFSGMLKSMAGIVEHGIPMETRTTVSAAMGMGGDSHSVVESVQLASFDDAACARTIIPEGYNVQSMDEAMNAAMGGGNQGDQAEAAASMNEAMSELNKAMESMTPEQREAMQSMGLGGLFGGAAAGGNQAAASAPAAASASGASRSAAMSTGSLEQSAQKMLQALGYDVGNTDGNIDTTTMISISQFQAENGLPVTGEVSPQLIGVLSAKVDAQ
ncbi:peptidoglycan-binding protein [Marinihelvus fidelis]|uniref:Peptidoglycan-binding protein n=1 Tax=Marinihelvus fidelis TaxID=2613842 RepID=A0A5N0TG72_9GAMM|nr:peptidoglycan-binding domain-containing protein [Marinihelvus fidelis]KAA9134040.1 peptidoglycan-binding protein [Marinihelvus fidelis]